MRARDAIFKLCRIRDDIFQKRNSRNWKAVTLDVEALDTAIEALGKEESVWVPVEEGLPEADMSLMEYPTVAICLPDERVTVGRYYESTGEWGTGKDFLEKCSPVAWMYLPKLYGTGCTFQSYIGPKVKGEPDE